MSEENQVVTPEAPQTVGAEDELYALMLRVARSSVAVVDALSRRGAFAGDELSTIGRLSDEAKQLIAIGEAYQQNNS